MATKYSDKLYRNAFGGLEYAIGPFFVDRMGIGTHRILKREPWYVTKASFAEMPWDTVPPFDSFIQACIWLKTHHTELL